MRQKEKIMEGINNWKEFLSESIMKKSPKKKKKVY